MIIEKQSCRILTVNHKNELVLADTSAGYNQWMCLDNRGFFSFLEPKTGKYLGRSEDWKMRATAPQPLAWECIVVREHPGGSFQMLVPMNGDTLRVVCLEADGKRVTTRWYGETLWEFVRF
jgi:hypothetical protein